MSEIEKKKIKLSERKEVLGTGKSNFFISGKSYMVHPELAKKLKAAGKIK